MTKVRPPVTIEQALFRVLGELGPARAAEVTGRAPGYLTSLSDQDTRFQLSVKDALALDLAFAAERAEVSAAVHPIFEAYGLLIEAGRADRFGTAEALQRSAVDVARENGEACAALIRAAFVHATPADRDAALRELEESHAATTAAIALLKQSRPEWPDTPRGHGPGP